MAGKGDVINAIAEQAGISKKEASAAFDAFVGYISDSATRGERCAIPGPGPRRSEPAHEREDHHPGVQERPVQGRQGSSRSRELSPARREERAQINLPLQPLIDAPVYGAFFIWGDDYTHARGTNNFS